MFLRRSYDAEMLDDFSIRDTRIDSALIELRVINILLGGNSISREGIRKLNKESCPLTVLDIGAGASDILRSIKNKFSNLVIYSLDRNRRACIYLKGSSAEVKVTCGDVLNLPFDKPFDIVHASLFLHHFDEEEIRKIISSLLKLSVKGIVINDLRRSIFAWLGIKVLTYLFSKSEAVKYDAPLSVRRGFIRKDWTDMLDKIIPCKYSIKRKWAFRWLVVIYK